MRWPGRTEGWRTARQRWTARTVRIHAWGQLMGQGWSGACRRPAAAAAAARSTPDQSSSVPGQAPLGRRTSRQAPCSCGSSPGRRLIVGRRRAAEARLGSDSPGPSAAVRGVPAGSGEEGEGLPADDEPPFSLRRVLLRAGGGGKRPQDPSDDDRVARYVVVDAEVVPHRADEPPVGVERPPLPERQDVLAKLSRGALAELGEEVLARHAFGHDAYGTWPVSYTHL